MVTPTTGQPRRLLAVSSGGGHWVQLCRLIEAFDGLDLAFATVPGASRARLPSKSRLYSFRDATRWDRWSLLVCAVQVTWIVLRERPDVVISTGAAPGYFALRIAKLLGAKTIWLDSLANIDELSLSGRKVKPFADLWLTQWEHLATSDGPQYRGAVL